MKKVILSIIVTDKEAEKYSREMENIPMASESVYTLACGDIQDLTEEEEAEMKDNVPDDVWFWEGDEEYEKHIEEGGI